MAITGIYDLSVNYLKDKIGLDSLPRFSYKLRADSRGAAQKSRRIQVALSPDAFDSHPVWDSGVIECSNTLHIPFEGAKLSPLTRYFWRVTATDSAGAAVTAEPAFFVTGKLDSRWNANWITAHFIQKEDTAFAAPYLRKEFLLDAGIKEAFLAISGLGYFEASINGAKVGDDCLSTPFTQFDEEVMYSVYDVTDMLQKGQNAIGVVVGNGWYNCFAEDPWNTRQASWRHWPKAVAELHVTLSDGTKFFLPTNNTWMSAHGPIYFNGIRNGEHYDARNELGDWTNPGYDESEWKNAKIIRHPGGRLIAMELEPIKVMQKIPAKKMWKTDNGWVFDIGQNQSGVALLTLRGETGDELTIKYSDEINEDGTLNQTPIAGFVRSHGFQTDKYTKKSDEPETWHAIFVYHGYQYVEISGNDCEPQLSDVVALTMYTSFDNAGSFECSDELLNKVQHLCWWSSSSNSHSILTDCPHREKNGWTGDASVSSEQMLTNFASRAFFKKWLGDIRTAQRPMGSIPCVVPSTGWGYNGLNGPDWSSALTFITWAIYTYNNDVQILRENYEAIKKHCGFMESMMNNYIVHYGLGDWCAPFEGPAISINMGSFKCPTAVTDTAYFYNAADTIAKIAAIFGYAEDVEYYSELAANIKKAFRDKFFDKATSTVAGDCQTSTAVMLYQGLAEEDEKQGLLDKLVQQIHDNDDHLDFGLLGNKYVMHSLGAMGEGNLGFTMLAQRTFPGCQQWIDLGATTLWECWNGKGSHNHHLFSDLSSFMYKYVAGISPDENSPGFTHTILRPAINCGLEFAKATHESMYGTILCDWSNRDGKQSIAIDIPVGCTASLYLPACYEGLVSEDGKPVAGEIRGGEYVISIVSGSYRFSAAQA